jgi:hypothetical protein
LWPFGRFLASICAAISLRCAQIPYSAEQRVFYLRAGNSSSGQGIHLIASARRLRSFPFTKLQCAVSHPTRQPDCRRCARTVMDAHRTGPDAAFDFRPAWPHGTLLQGLAAATDLNVGATENPPAVRSALPQQRPPARAEIIAHYRIIPISVKEIASVFASAPVISLGRGAGASQRGLSVCGQGKLKCRTRADVAGG